MSGPEFSAQGKWSRLVAILGAVFVHLLFAVLALVGVLMVLAMVREWRAGNAGGGEALVFAGFGGLLALIGVGFYYFAYIGVPRFLARLERGREKYRDRPWLINRQWRARRAIFSIKYTAWFMWFWCALWWGILGFLWSVNRDEILAALQGPWSEAIPTSIPFVAGGIGLLVALSLTWSRWRHGDAVLLIDTLPGYLGGRFAGRIRAGTSGPLNEPLTIILACGQMVKRPVKSGRRGTSWAWVFEADWTRETVIRPEQTVFDGRKIQVPVDLPLPGDLPESGHILDEPQVVWKLKVSPGSVLDQRMTCEFEIPVFRRGRRDE